MNYNSVDNKHRNRVVFGNFGSISSISLWNSSGIHNKAVATLRKITEENIQVDEVIFITGSYPSQTVTGWEGFMHWASIFRCRINSQLYVTNIVTLFFDDEMDLVYQKL